MENSLVNILKNQPIGKSYSTGLTLYQSYKASSGFDYQIGMREASGLYIFEGFAEGISCAYLNKILVFFGNDKQLIADINFPQGTFYSRKTAKEGIKQELCKYFYEACIKEGEDFSKEEIDRQVSDILDQCYFAESRKAVLNWAKKVGILKSNSDESSQTI